MGLRRFLFDKTLTPVFFSHLALSAVSLRELLQRHHEEFQGEGEVRRPRDREGGGRALQVSVGAWKAACAAG